LTSLIWGGYITSAMAKTEAVSRGFDEAILLNSSGKVCEGTGMNLFLVREIGGEKVLITPSVDQDILEGITRISVIQIAQSLGIKVLERAVDKSELLVAEEVFLTGTAAQITPINQIENYILQSEKPIFEKLRAVFDQIITKNYQGENGEYKGWTIQIN
jgi:branched-chain amino acid aminotransferase